MAASWIVSLGSNQHYLAYIEQDEQQYNNEHDDESDEESKEISSPETSEDEGENGNVSASEVDDKEEDWDAEILEHQQQQQQQLLQEPEENPNVTWWTPLFYTVSPIPDSLLAIEGVAEFLTNVFGRDATAPNFQREFW